MEKSEYIDDMRSQVSLLYVLLESSMFDKMERDALSFIAKSMDTTLKQLEGGCEV